MSTSVRPLRFGRRLLFAALAIAATLALVEALLRTALRIRGAPYSAAAVREELVATVGAMLSTLPEETGPKDPLAAVEDPEFKPILSPYTGWTTETHLASLAADLPRLAREPGGELRVLILGASVAAKFARDGQQKLAEGLREVAGLEDATVVFFNQGLGAIKQPQQALHLLFLFSLGCRPDLVINLDGFNEVSLSMANAASGVHPSYPAANFWSYLAHGVGAGERSAAIRALCAVDDAERAAESLLASVERRGLHRAAVTGLLARSRLRRLHATWTSSMAEYTAVILASEDGGVVSGPRFAGSPADALAITVETWMRSSLAMKGLCDANGVEYLHVLEPTLTDPGSKPPAPRELEILAESRGKTTFVDRGYPLMRAAGAELAAHGVRFVDATQVFAEVEQRVYQDVCHYTPRGNRLLADFLVQPVAEALLECLRSDR